MAVGPPVVVSANISAVTGVIHTIEPATKLRIRLPQGAFDKVKI
jgi:hypothetical protein